MTISETSPFEGRTPVPAVHGPASGATMISGRSFALSDNDGNMSPQFTQGLFVLDTRVLSQWLLTLNGETPEPLGVDSPTPFQCTFVGRGRPPVDQADAHIVVIRQRAFGSGMTEQIEITNHGLEPAVLRVALVVDCDFADLFEVKESRLVHRDRNCSIRGTGLQFRRAGRKDGRHVVAEFGTGARVDSTGAQWSLTLAPGQSWRQTVSVAVRLDNGKVLGPNGPLHHGPDSLLPPEHDETIPLAVFSDNIQLMRTISRSADDLTALRIRDETHPQLALVAAGAPWFMTLFGRDSLLTAWMSLISDPALARGVLETLARLQGTRIDPRSGEEPGKILHEARYADSDARTLDGAELYFGSVDATELFVIMAAELQRWNPSTAFLDRLLPHVDRAMDWIETYGDQDGDGYVEYERVGDYGLVNQGWKDSWDAIRHADGSLATGPIATCEVQAYVYGAYVARAELAKETGDQEIYQDYVGKAARLYERFNQDFWDEDGQFYVLALDGAKNRVAVPTSNVGHCLWTGIVRPDRARAVADLVVAESMNSGWGVRTLDARAPAYNPVSYHNGSVWPHDNAICAWGLSKYGFQKEATTLINQQLEVSAEFEGRLPELFAGFDRRNIGTPAVYPSSCSPQAWAAAAPLLWVRTLLRLEPLATQGRFWLDPELPDTMDRLRVSGISIGDNRIRIDVGDDRVSVSGTGDLAVVPMRRPFFDPVAAFAEFDLASADASRGRP